MKRIVYEIETGLSVVYPNMKQLEGESEDQYLSRCAAKLVPDGVNWLLIDASVLPQDRRWRNAWKLNGGRVEIDLEKAKKVRAAELHAEAEAERVNAAKADADEVVKDAVSLEDLTTKKRVK